MSETPNQQKPPSGRRRNGRSNGRSAAQKAYASENDMGYVDASQHDYMSPQTPSKMNTASPAANSGRTASAKQQRSKNKSNKNKNGGATSPEPDQPAHAPRTTPQRPSSVKAPNSMAFAGATFHASPAPSALPMPSFFSKPAGGSPNARDGFSNVQQEPTPPASGSTNPTPQRQTAGSSSNESPLDFMFRAHRSEQQQHHAPHPAAGTPPSDSPFGARSLPKPSSMPQHRPTAVRQTSNTGLDDDEFGDHFGQPMGPAFSTPYQDRIKAARPSHGPNQGLSHGRPIPIPGQGSPAQRAPASEDPTEALKKYLFSNAGQQNASASPIRQPQQPPTARVADRQMDPPEGPHIQAMENDLRRILKLDSQPAPQPQPQQGYHPQHGHQPPPGYYGQPGHQPQPGYYPPPGHLDAQRRLFGQ